MAIVRVNEKTGQIIGRSRDHNGPDCIEVSDDLWGRIAADPNAFEYVLETKSIELKATYKQAPEQDIGIKDTEQYLTAMQELIAVPELNIQVTLGGVWGRVLLAALALAQHCPQRIMCSDLSGKMVVVEIDKKASELIAGAFARHSDKLLNTGEVEDE
ncbi:hypothetical protein pEaSNUABM5_00101 [Erwinia phage pEa_SNUABM_5]|uniref:Uncharacterized protein n=1 Tax=Erwinia phage pEa_SNUABM_5 TaxID=2797313 RepID=A0A7T8IVU5_9CAUD|nr:hypothetical protein MPK73_gp101 [Erwinia phage pEa_SNUABM_5]QQO90243.1 hypothetical protein pEaSNUABM5_00101 [Erwinia phage pEa_SNUABM_5]